MIKWNNVNDKDKLPETNRVEEYLVTIEYTGEENINNRMVLSMTYEEKGRKAVPTWCWHHTKSIWKVLFWAKFPDPCQDEI